MINFAKNGEFLTIITTVPFIPSESFYKDIYQNHLKYSVIIRLNNDGVRISDLVHGGVVHLELV